MSNISLHAPANYSETFLYEYCKNGLGSRFSKRDVDVLVFFLLLQDERYKLPEDIFKACRELKLSETKVRRRGRIVFRVCGQNPELLTRWEAVHVFERKETAKLWMFQNYICMVTS